MSRSRSSHLTNRNGSPLLQPIKNLTPAVMEEWRPRDNADHYIDHAGQNEESPFCHLRSISSTHIHLFANHRHYASLHSKKDSTTTHIGTHHRGLSISDKTQTKSYMYLVSRSFLPNPQCHHRARPAHQPISTQPQINISSLCAAAEFVKKKQERRDS